MGYLLFGILILLDIVYNILSIKKKAYDVRFKRYSDVGVFLLVLLLFVAKVLEWGIRYYLLLLLLFIRAIIAVIHIVKKNDTVKQLIIKRLIGRDILCLFLYQFAVIPAIIFPQYKEIKVTGEYKVATKVYTYTDEKRVDPFSKNGENRFVNVEFWYPNEDVKDCPLILFSHGSFGYRMSNESTYRELASHGYVVCSIDHPYHSFYTKSTSGKITIVSTKFFNETMNVNKDYYDANTQIKVGRDNTMLRVEDMNFVIETILDKVTSEKQDEVYGRIDKARIGVMGHSLGGAAAIELGRKRDDISAVVNLDGDMLCEYLGMEEGKLKINQEIYPCPLLNIWSETLVNLMEKEFDQYEFPLEYIAKTAKEEFDIYYEGTSHFNYTDLVIVSPIMSNVLMKASGVSSKTTVNARDTLTSMNQNILEFFDCYLKQVGTFLPDHPYQLE